MNTCAIRGSTASGIKLQVVVFVAHRLARPVQSPEGLAAPAASASRSAACPFARRDQIRRRGSKPLQRRRHTSLSGQLTRREPALRCMHVHDAGARPSLYSRLGLGRLTAHAHGPGAVRCDTFSTVPRHRPTASRAPPCLRRRHACLGGHALARRVRRARLAPVGS